MLDVGNANVQGTAPVASAGGAEVAKHPTTWQSVAHQYPFGYVRSMRPMRFLGDSLKRLREFPEDVRQDAGDPLEKVQKQAQATSPRDVELARTRWLALSNER